MRALATCLALLTAFLLAHAPPAQAHALQPGYLELTTLGKDTWAVLWKKPAIGNAPMPIDAVLPENCDIRRAPETRPENGAFTARWAATCPGGLQGGTLEIEGLPATQTDVLIRYELTPDTPAQTARLTAVTPVLILPEPGGRLSIMRTYITLGTDHILEGVDHLMFVFALLLLIRDRMRLLGAITAFTLAHSLTLAASTLGWIRIPVPPVETIIALSIVVLALEILRSTGDGTRLSERWPWVVSFSFGLLHGLGFASALFDIGLPEGEVPLALLSFNIGVELGQLLFIGAVLLSGLLIRRFAPRLMAAAAQPHSTAIVGASYLIGGVSSWWMIDRIAGF